MTAGTAVSDMSAMRLLRPLLDYCFPSRCSHCGSTAGDFPVPFLCATCWADLSPVPAPVCPRCGRPFGSPATLAASPEHTCRQCRRDPPDVDQALAAGIFEGSLREAIHVYKYRPLMALGGPLAAWMLERIRKVDRLDVVMPVPLHRSRLRKRGFNQALLLARSVSVSFSVPLHFDNLIRVRPTKPQVELSGRERTANVAGAFALRCRDDVEGKRVLLIDDVLTTGATMNECSRTLRTAGAEAVIALTLARTID